MCWSYEVSLVTVTIVVSSVVLMLIRRASRQDVGNALWCSVFGSMQIIDLLLWVFFFFFFFFCGLFLWIYGFFFFFLPMIQSFFFSPKMENDQGDLKSCSMSNQRITRYGFYIISLEPIASLLSRMYINKQFYPKTLLVYIFFFIILPWIGRDYLNDWCSDTYCTHLTEEGNLILGLGVDEKNGLACWMKYFFFGEHQTEIPLLLRVFFLVGIFAPFLGDVPLLKGLIHASIITITWLIGFFSASHASVWCMANVAQCLLCAVDPYLFPLHKAGSPVNRGKRGDILQDNYLKKKVPENLDAIVVGSGIGGLTTAAMMAKAGKRVLVLEQHYRAGGATHTFDEFGNLFDSGIHYVGANDFCVPILGLIGDVPVKWSQMGKKEDDFCYDEFDLGDPNDLYRYRKGREAIMEELLTRFPHEKEGIKAYFKNLGNAQMATYSFAILKILPLSWQNSFVGRWLFSLFLSKAADRSATEEVEKFIKDPKLRALLSGGQLIDWNLAPDRTSWWVVASMMSYYFDGGFYPVGGSQTIAQSIIPTIEKSGGRVLTNVRVEEFVMSDDEEAVIGIRLHNGDEISAPIVISDAGATNTYAKLLPLSALKKKGLDLSKLEKIQPSNGHMTAFVNFDGPSSKFDLRPANIHSFGDLPKFDYSISEMQRALYRDQKKISRWLFNYSHFSFCKRS